MAENTSVVQNVVEHRCDIIGCMYHEVSQTSSAPKGEEKVLYKFRVHFRDLKEVYKHAVRDMQRDVALLARNRKPISVRSDGSPLDIYADCSYTRTVEDELKDIEKMNDEEKVAYGKMLMLKLQALEKANSVAADEPSTKKK